MSQSDLPVFVLSLKDEIARREAMDTHLKQCRLNCLFLDAVDGRAMDVTAHPAYDGPRRLAAHGRHLKPGELGCLLSHRAAYQKIIDDNLDCALLLEDDARLHEDTKAVLNAALDKNFEFDVIRLLGSPKVAKGKHRKIIRLYNDFYLVRLRTAPGGAHATLISKKGAAKLLKATEKFAFPIDTILGRFWETGIQAYSIQPGLAVQDLSFESAIGEERHDKTATPKNLKFKASRLGFKIGEALGKAYTYWGNAPKDLATRKKFG